MIALLGAVLLASLLGSLHCAGMCGPLVAFAVGAHPAAPGGRMGPHLAYHLGRLAAYTGLGVIGGALGHALDAGGALLGLQRVAAVVAGAMILGFALVILLRWRGVHFGAQLPAWLARLGQRAHRLALALPPTRRAGVVGLLSALLPCGWLYAFAITAAGTASPLWGGAVMAVFWVGTVPMLLVVGGGVQRLAAWTGAKAPLATALVLAGVGLYTIAGRAAIPASALRAHAPACRAPAAVPDPNATPACCRHHE